MKKIEALIQAFQLEVVTAALRKHGVEEMVASEVLGAGPSQARSYRGVQYAVDYAPRVKLEVVVSDELVMSTANTISDAVRMGPVDDARISVAPVERAVEIEGWYEPAAVRSPARRYRPVWGLWGKRPQHVSSAS